MSKRKINELTEILTDALAGRPDLQERFSKLLEIGAKTPAPKSKKAESVKERKNRIKKMFTAMFLAEQNKKRDNG